MFGFSKKKSSSSETAPEQAGILTEEAPKTGWFGRLKSGLKKTRVQFNSRITTLFTGKHRIDDELLEELETILLTSDVGLETTQLILDNLKQRVSKQQANDADSLQDALKNCLIDLLKPSEQALTLKATPSIILMVGVNGAGKTTSIAKLAHHYKNLGKSVLLAAGDTFRAGAIEQLSVWGERNQVPVIAQKEGSDSAAVIYDAIQSAQAKGVDVVIADTAGRLHTQDHLMKELEKVKRVMSKLNEEAPHETLLVIDASNGQNALRQAQSFHDALGLTGVALTKLDGTAKGGIIFAIANTLKLPIRFVGVGEGIDDLKPFVAQEFVDALFAE